MDAIVSIMSICSVLFQDSDGLRQNPSSIASPLWPWRRVAFLTARVQRGHCLEAQIIHGMAALDPHRSKNSFRVFVVSSWISAAFGRDKGTALSFWSGCLCEQMQLISYDIFLFSVFPLKGCQHDLDLHLFNSANSPVKVHQGQTLGETQAKQLINDLLNSFGHSFSWF